MRFTVGAVSLVVVCALLSGCDGEDGVKPIVKTTASIALTAPGGSTKESLTEQLQGAIGMAAEGESNESLKGQKEGMAENTAGLMGLACGILDDFMTKDAIAVPNVLVTPTPEGLCIGVVNIIVYDGAPDQMTIDHEAGHAFINNEIATRCRCEWDDVTDANELLMRVQDAQQRANQAYETATMDGNQGDQAMEAEKAVADVVMAGC